MGLEGEEGALHVSGRACGAGVEDICMGGGSRKLCVMSAWEISASLGRGLEGGRSCS